MLKTEGVARGFQHSPRDLANVNEWKIIFDPYNKFEILQIVSLISKDQKKNIICTMDDVRGDFLGPPHGTTPAAVIATKNNC